MPCNGVSIDNVPVGSDVTVSTDVEELTYTVTAARKVPPGEFEHDAEIWDVNPGR